MLFAIYLPTYGGGPHSVDEIAYVGVARSIVLRGSFDTNELYWMMPVAGDPRDAQSAIGPSGDTWAKKGPAASIAMAPLIALARASGRDLVFVGLTAMMFVTAATGALLVLYSRSIGISPREALAVGLAYGLATLAMPYARLGFSEPIAAFAIILAALCTTRTPTTSHFVAPRWRTLRPAACGAPLAAGVALGLAIWSRPSEALVAAPIAIYAGLRWDGRRRLDVGRLASLAIGGGLMALTFGAYNLARFGHPLATGYALANGESFNGNIADGLIGLVASPYRGLLFYTPLAVVAIVVAPLAWRTHRAATALGLTVAILHILTFAAWWKWWAGAGWGPRFLLPAIPLLMPIVALAWPRLARRARVAVVAVACLAVPIQLLGSTQDFNPFERLLAERWPGFPEGSAMLSPRAWGVWGHAGRIVSLGVGAFDVAWLRGGVVTWRLVVPMTVAIVVGAFALWRGGARGRLRATDAFAVAASIVAFAGLVSVGPRSWTGSEADLVAAATSRIPRSRPGDGTIVIATPDIPALWRSDSSPLPVYGFNPTDGAAAEGAAGLLSAALARHDRLWVLVPGIDPDAPTNATEREIAARAYFVSRGTFGTARIDLYAVAVIPAVSADDRIATFDGTIVLTGALVRAISDDTLAVDLRFSAPSPPTRSTKVFVHAYDRSGHLLGQSDRSFASHDPWTGGFSGRYGILTPPYGDEIIVDVGVYDGATGRRLTARDPAGNALPADRVTIDVVAPRKPPL
ncbi:MAG: hypothetical protein EPO26_18815 [Chloroflexota bacterium]|nr:MAG: hypothetical protein EPO26_18815 [Chloroflexota bacterium]